MVRPQRRAASESGPYKCPVNESCVTSEDGGGADIDEAAKWIRAEDGNDDGEGHGNRIHDEARRGSDAEDGFAQSHGERNAGGGSDETTYETENNGFREEEIEDAAGGASDGFHHADVVAAFSGDIGHGGHDAEGGEGEDERGSGGEQAGDARINFGLGFRELAERPTGRIGKFRLKFVDKPLNLLGTSGDADLYLADRFCTS